MHAEKDSSLAKKEAAKENLLQRQNARELKNLINDQRVEIKKMKLKHEHAYFQSIHNISIRVKLGANSQATSKVASGNSSKFVSVENSVAGSAHRSGTSSPGVLELPSTKLASAGIVQELMLESHIAEDVDDEADGTQKNKYGQTIADLVKRHKEERMTLENATKQDINDCVLAVEAKVTEMEELHAVTSAKLLETQEREIFDLQLTQEKEIKMEESMHDSEMKMLVERRVLNCVLDSVADGN
jgi:hypothetical protein